MASELRVNSSTNRSGLGTITYTDSGPIISGVGTFTNGFTVDGTQTTVKSLKLTGDNYNANWFKTSDKLRFNDNAKATFGTSDDLSIWHNGTHTYIQESGAGALQIRGTNLILDNADGSKRYIDCNDGGSVELYNNGNKKFETTNTGVTVTGQIAASTGVFSSAITASTYIQGTSSNGGLKFYSDSSASKGVILNTDDHLVPSNDSNSDLGLTGTRWRNAYVDTYYGDGSNLTNLPAQATIANNADNRVITGGSGVNLNGESNLTYDGTNLQLITDANSEGIKSISNGNSYPIFELDSDRASSGNTIGKLVSKWNNTEVASIQFVSGDDSSNKDNASIYLNTRSGGSGNVLRLRITQDGQLGTTAIVRSAYGGLDLCSQGATNYGTLTLGAGGGQNGQSRSSNQENQFRIMMPTYADPSLMTTVLYGVSGSSGHDLHYGGGTGWAYATNTHRFFTTANQTTGNGTERIRVHSGGTVNVPSGITLGQSVSSTAASNTLDDYEEGSYVVSVTGSSSGSFALNPNSFRYTKIGRTVHVSGRFYVVSGSPTGAEVRVSLPFTASSHDQSQDGSAYSYVSTWNAYSPNNDYQMVNSVIANTAYSVLIWIVPNGQWISVSPSSHMNQRNAYYGFDFTYTTAT